MGKPRPIPSRIPTFDARRIKPDPKRADAELLTVEHRVWAEEVIRRAGYRCEEVENGVRCTKSRPMHRLYADHVIERRDGGAPLDPANGKCRCASHHSRKTIAERVKRLSARP